jgi:hypothetical protein
MARSGLMKFKLILTNIGGKSEEYSLELIMDHGRQVYQVMEMANDQYQETAYFENGYSLSRVCMVNGEYGHQEALVCGQCRLIRQHKLIIDLHLGFTFKK